MNFEHDYLSFATGNTDKSKCYKYDKLLCTLLKCWKYHGRYTKHCITWHPKLKVLGDCESFNFLNKWAKVNFLVWLREIDILLFSLVFLRESDSTLPQHWMWNSKIIKDQEFLENETNPSQQRNPDSLLQVFECFT